MPKAFVNVMRQWKGAVEPTTVVSETLVTNHGLQSNDMAASWIPILQGGAMVSNVAIAPNGLLEATEFFGDEGEGTSGQVRHIDSPVGLIEGQLYRYSIYVKNVQGDDWLLFTNNGFAGATDRGGNYFNIVTGVAGVISPSGVSGIESANLTYPDAPAGWWRLWGHVRPIGDTLGGVDAFQRTGDTHPFGNRANNSYYGWGFLVEPVSDATLGVPSALVETTTVAPITERIRTFDDAGPTKQKVTNVLGFSHTLEAWFGVLNLNVQDNMERHGFIPLALLTDDATDGFHYVGQVNQYVADATLRRLSIYVKMGTARYCIITDRIPSTANVQWSNVFDMQDGVWTFKGNLYKQDKYEAENLGNGLWRISFVSAVNSGAYDNHYVGISSGPTKEDQSYIGVGDTLYAGGGQVEYGTDASPGPLVRHDAAGTGDGQATRTFGGNTIGVYKGAVEPPVGRLFGLPSFELPLATGLNNQEIPIRTVGSSILKIDLFNSSFVVVDRRTVIQTELWNSNTIIKVAD